MTVHEIVAARELLHRSNDGIDVTLFWHPADDCSWVSVNDRKTGDAFTVDVLAGDHAIDVFHHPYAYGIAQRTAN